MNKVYGHPNLIREYNDILIASRIRKVIERGAEAALSEFAAMRKAGNERLNRQCGQYIRAIERREAARRK